MFINVQLVCKSINFNHVGHQFNSPGQGLSIYYIIGFFFVKLCFFLCLKGSFQRVALEISFVLWDLKYVQEYMALLDIGVLFCMWLKA
jgi:hypothetical protein